MKIAKQNSIILVLGIVAFGLIAAYVLGIKDNSTQEAVTNEVQVKEVNEAIDKKLFVYCGAGMKKPFDEIIAAFQQETGIQAEVTYGNAAQIITQITASNEGDVFIAGDQGELAKIQEEYVLAVKPLVKHIPVIAVPKGNPKSVKTLLDFAKEDVEVVLGDNQATPIGKLADKALVDAGILEKVNIIARSATAPEITTALSLGECDATIIWKENARGEGIEIVESNEMEKYIKLIPAASLKCGANDKMRDEFLKYLDTAKVNSIWEKHGYETAN